MDVHERVAQEFDLGTPVTAEPLHGGGPQVVRLTTPRGRFVVKPVYRVSDWELYAVVEQVLNTRGIRQARLFRTSSGGVASSTGHSVQEYLPGVIVDRPGQVQAEQAMRHLAAYDQALATVARPAGAPLSDLAAVDTVWTRVASPAYLVDALPRLVRDHAPGWVDPAPVADGLELLTAAAPLIDGLPRQVVHGDIGPDNVLYDGDEVVAILDFTPFHAPALFGLSTALYWYHVHGVGCLDVERIRSSVAAYDEVRRLSGIEGALVVPMLLLEALRRFATPLAVAEESGVPVPEDATRRRYDALLETLALAAKAARASEA
jgi:Ser/Thr protein kinase RdoA (MazF antagonist)